MFITDYPALKIKKSLVIADLHIGIEYEILQKGVIVNQVDDLINRVINLINLTKANELIILGDVKHNVPYIQKQELKIPFFLKEINKSVKVKIIPGNHDSFIKKLIPDDVIITDPSGLLINNYGLLHGHTKLPEKMKKSKTIIIGHNHPVIKFKDKLGLSFIRQVWLIGHNEKQKIIIMPAFSKLVGGTVINELEDENELLGPIAKQIDLNNANVFLLDGTNLGMIKDLKI